MSYDDDRDPESWITYRRLVVSTIEDLESRTRKLEGEMLAIKIKAGLVGAAAGLVPALVTLAISIWETFH